MGSQRLDQLAEASGLDGSELLYVFKDGTDRHIKSDTYRKDDRPAILGAVEMASVLGSPAIVSVGNGIAALAFDDASDEQAAGSIDVPASWSTYDVDVWHTTLTGNSGNAESVVRMLAPSEGQDLNQWDVGINKVSVPAVATAETLGITTLLSGITAIAGPNFFQFWRDGNFSDDTLTGDFMVLALVIRKAS